MINDPIVEEVRNYRKEHAAQYGNDLARIVEALRQRERESNHIQLNPGPKLLVKSVGWVKLTAQDAPKQDAHPLLK
ncbi:MAG: hypothetical protein ACKN9W_12370 [Methylococcus sp.]